MLFMLAGNSDWLFDPPSYQLFASFTAGKDKAYADGIRPAFLNSCHMCKSALDNFDRGNVGLHHSSD
jgi:hypothetical protein